MPVLTHGPPPPKLYPPPTITPPKYPPPLNPPQNTPQINRKIKNKYCGLVSILLFYVFFAMSSLRVVFQGVVFALTFFWAEF